MKKMLLLLTLCAGLQASAQTALPAWSWARSGGNADANTGSGVVVGKDGAVYVASSFTDTAMLGTTQLPVHAPGMALLKYSNTGSLLWAKMLSNAISSIGYAISRSLATDASGNLLISGYFSGNMVAGSDTLMNPDNQDIFLIKADTSGQVLWARSWGGTGEDNVLFGLATDSIGHIYLNGYGEISLSLGEPPATAWRSQAVLLQYDTDGHLNWQQQTSGENHSRGFGVAADAAGNVYSSGFTGAGTLFGTDTLAEEGAYLASHDSAGNLQWVKQIVGNAIGFSVAADKDGNIIYGGGFESSASVDGVSFGSGAPGFFGYFIKMTPEGTVLWARSFGVTGWLGDDFSDIPFQIVTDAEGDIYACGSYRDSISFEGNTFHNLPGSGGIFVAKYHSDGTYAWAKTAFAGALPEAAGLAVAGVDDVYVTGAFNGTQNMDMQTLSSLGDYDLFVARLQMGLGVATPAAPANLEVWPNPATGKLNIRLPEQETFHTCQLQDVTGKTVLRQSLDGQTGVLNLDISALPAGSYVLQLISREGTLSRKITVSR